MTIYISGPITDNPNYISDFAEAAASLRSAGHPHIYNPAADPLASHTTWAEYMRRDLEVILGAATGICLLPGWENSRGARIEVDVAKAIGLPVKTTASWILTPPDPLHEPDDETDVWDSPEFATTAAPWETAEYKATAASEAAGWEDVDQAKADEHYHHLSEVAVQEGQEVKKGQQIGSVQIPKPEPTAHLTVHADGKITNNFQPGDPEYKAVRITDPEPLLATTTPPRCIHHWTHIDTLPPIKECAECGETRIIHS